MTGIRYSHAFKMQAVREVESGRLCAWEVTQKYGVHGRATVMRWVRQLGSGKYGKNVHYTFDSFEQSWFYYDSIKQITWNRWIITVYKT